MNKPSRIPANGPRGAVEAPPRTALGPRKDVARKGVRSALDPESHDEHRATCPLLGASEGRTAS